MTEPTAPARPEALTTPRACDLIRDRTGRRPSEDSLIRWTIVGVRLGDKTVKLPAVRVGRLRFFQPADLDNFLATIQPA